MSCHSRSAANSKRHPTRPFSTTRTSQRGSPPPAINPNIASVPNHAHHHGDERTCFPIRPCPINTYFPPLPSPPSPNVRAGLRPRTLQHYYDNILAIQPELRALLRHHPGEPIRIEYRPMLVISLLISEQARGAELRAAAGRCSPSRRCAGLI